METLVDQIFAVSIKVSKSIAMASVEMINKREGIRTELKGMKVDLKALADGDYRSMFGSGEKELKEALKTIKKAFNNIAETIDGIIKDLREVVDQRSNFELIGEKYLLAFGVKEVNLSDELNIRDLFGVNAKKIINSMLHERAMVKRWMMFFELINSFIESYAFDDFDELINNIKNGKAVIHWDVGGFIENLEELKEICFGIAEVTDDMAVDVENVFKIEKLSKSAEMLARLFQ